jgi:DtxR family transcriptional regulator, Mn-dependent transcriptional regulator
MTDPISALIIALIIILIAVLILWPQKGIFWQFKTGVRNTERVLMEDTLKQLYDHEYRGRVSTLKSISGALEKNMYSTAKILEKLSAQGLTKFEDSVFKLTMGGRKYALRIIRAHRLWERYFADETGLAEPDWHKEAEMLEHTTTAAEAEALAGQMGYPAFDPHGDPIPTVKGEMPPRVGMYLSNMEPGEKARITHIEDEPEALYAQLIAEGLYPGMEIRVLEKTAQKIHFNAEGEEIVLAPIVASNITVIKLSAEQEIEIPAESLLDLKPGESGEVTIISKACRGMQRRRLMDLGIVPGTEISAEFASSSANPVAYNIRGALIALRNDQAKMIKIKKLSQMN